MSKMLVVSPVCNLFLQTFVRTIFPMTMTGNEAARTISAFVWLVRQSGAAVKPNDVILTNLITSHCFNPIP